MQNTNLSHYNQHKLSLSKIFIYLKYVSKIQLKCQSHWHFSVILSCIRKTAK